MSSSDIVTDEQIADFIQEDLEDYRIDNTIPNYVTDESGPDTILKTEIHICPKCMYPDIIGSEQFNRRVKTVKQIRMDNVTYASLRNFSELNNIDMNSTIALLLRIAQNPEVAKMLIGTFSGFSKRKGKNYRSKSIITSS